MKSGPDRKFTAAFRQSAVQQVEAGRSMPAVAKSLEMSVKTLANWVYRARAGEPMLKREPNRPVTELEAEVSRLRSENARLKVEAEILKKATAYFAKQLP